MMFVRTGRRCWNRKRKKDLLNAISKKRWEAMGFSWLERASVEAKPRRCFTRMRSQVRVLLSPPKNHTNMVWFFFFAENKIRDASPSKCRCPAGICRTPAGRCPLFTIFQWKIGRRVLLSAAKQNNLSMLFGGRRMKKNQLTDPKNHTANNCREPTGFLLFYPCSPSFLLPFPFFGYIIQNN